MLRCQRHNHGESREGFDSPDVASLACSSANAQIYVTTIARQAERLLWKRSRVSLRRFYLSLDKLVYLISYE
jgi:hypothetical protein